MGASLRREDSVLREENCSNFLCGHSHVVWWAKENKIELIFLDLYRISISYNRGWRPRFLLSVGKRNPWSTESSYCTPNPWARLNCHPGLLKKFRFSQAQLIWQSYQTSIVGPTTYEPNPCEIDCPIDNLYACTLHVSISVHTYLTCDKFIDVAHSCLCKFGLADI